MKYLHVRLASQQDAERLAALGDQLGYPYTWAEMQQRLDEILRDERHAVFVAQLPDGLVVGWVHVSIRPMLLSERHIEVEGLIVDVNYRRCGIGRRLMQQVERWAEEQGCRWVYLCSNVVRQEAHLFYHRLGYRYFKTQLALGRRCRTMRI
jgi:GNAT superfamily N-acetyltransferase